MCGDLLRVLERFFTTGSAAGIQPAHRCRPRLGLTALSTTQGPRDMGLPGLDLHPLNGSGRPAARVKWRARSPAIGIRGLHKGSFSPRLLELGGETFAKERVKAQLHRIGFSQPSRLRKKDFRNLLYPSVVSPRGGELKEGSQFYRRVRKEFSYTNRFFRTLLGSYTRGRCPCTEGLLRSPRRKWRPRRLGSAAI